MSEEKTKTGRKHTTKISYQRCSICGGMKKEQDITPSRACVECFEKLNRNKDKSGFWQAYATNKNIKQKNRNHKK